MARLDTFSRALFVAVSRAVWARSGPTRLSRWADRRLEMQHGDPFSSSWRETEARFGWAPQAEGKCRRVSDGAGASLPTLDRYGPRVFAVVSFLSRPFLASKVCVCFGGGERLSSEGD